ncbi:Uncharacterised protein [Mycobacteroides abscessus subsp. abscessus]|nr:Uncharacterised protein [Mycobacteroides abscessus subsp. abscessus]SKU64022.1 Uncharacterised protein [Mycobacteroides abscessus subsp. abscessus]
MMNTAHPIAACPLERVGEVASEEPARDEIPRTGVGLAVVMQPGHEAQRLGGIDAQFSRRHIQEVAGVCCAIRHSGPGLRVRIDQGQVQLP